MNKPEQIITVTSNEHSQLEKWREEFFDQVDRLSLLPEEKRWIKKAYRSALTAHHGQYRQGGAPYFDHPREVANILIRECDVIDPEVIIAALLHDVLEDTTLYPARKEFSIGPKGFQEYKNAAAWDLTKDYNTTVAKMVLALSKPYFEKDPTQEEAFIYYSGLRQAIMNRPQAILIKMADRLHNLRTIDDMPPEKKRRKIKETNEVYIPLFKNLIKHIKHKINNLRPVIDDLRTRADNLPLSTDTKDSVYKVDTVDSIAKEIQTIKLEVNNQMKVRESAIYLLAEIEKITGRKPA